MNDEKLLQVFKANGYTNLARLSKRVIKAQHPSWGLVTIKYAQELKHRHFLKQEAEFLYSNTNFNTDSNKKDIWPNYCDYFSSYKSDCLVLSYMNGKTLLEIQADSDLADCLPSHWIRTLEATINQVHRLGFVHGDIKPSNIVLSPQGQAQLIDFGSVTKMGTERVALRFESYTPRYSMQHSVTNRLDDWFALAVMLEEWFHDSDVLPSRYQILLKQNRKTEHTSRQQKSG
ncbi:protein kinase domain-containing protein [Vibrio splendidus]|uniref:protein kinase domain-containing protein n=1 Tax=Vibrio splendidus TaxID=29497 RepID=UPI0024690A19|nr:AarF/UbiB family protein [Vibrio splendidus]MDH6018817.1 AarF/UbiB family protein [Vibrio splendidus]